jgi:hypothetical protein
MKNKNSIITLVLAMTVSLSGITSCTQWSTRDWNELKDRKFYFQKFTYRFAGETNENAFNFMKSEPLKETLNIVAKKYNIIIDVSEFQDFIYSDDYSKLSTSGLLQDSEFIWESRKKRVNQIEIEYDMRPDPEAKSVVITYRLSVKNNDKVRAFFYDRAYDRKKFLPNLAASFGYGALLKTEQDIKVAGDTKDRLILVDDKPGVDVNDGDVKSETATLIKKQIALYVRGLKPKEKKAFREDLVQFINAICK